MTSWPLEWIGTFGDSSPRGDSNVGSRYAAEVPKSESEVINFRNLFSSITFYFTNK